MSLQERIRKVKELHQEGLSLGQIAEMVGVSKGRFRKTRLQKKKGLRKGTGTRKGP
jgi:ribosomal protein L19E